MLATTAMNTNMLSKLNFRFLLHRAPNVEYFIQKATIPNVRLPASETSNPFVTIPYAGDHLKYDPLEIEFKVSENMSDYLEIYNWMQALGFPEKYQQYADLAVNPDYTGNGIYSDITISVLDSKKNTVMEAVFKECWPTSISSLEFDTTDTDVTYLTCKVSFRYMYFDVSKPEAC